MFSSLFECFETFDWLTPSFVHHLFEQQINSNFVWNGTRLLYLSTSPKQLSRDVMQMQPPGIDHWINNEDSTTFTLERCAGYVLVIPHYIYWQSPP
jgi:hypothetical protein